MSSKWIGRSRNRLIYNVLVFIAVALTPVHGDFQVYWNIPTFMCRRYNLPIENTTKLYDIIQNQNDDFRGDQISILYDPGEFPAILQNTSSGQYFYRNGGVPQEGSLRQHLHIFRRHVNELMPDPSFSGLAVIDFESWRPTYRQNFGTLKPYKDLSEKVERKRHTFWPTNRIQKEAERRFEWFGRRFMEETLFLGRRLRPNATWGYYGLPYCFNGRGNNVDSCPMNVRRENDQLLWLYEEVDTVFPSVYMNEHIPPANRAPLARGRVQESLRLIKKLPADIRPDVLAYYRYVYADTLNYLTEADTYGILRAIQEGGANGVVLWGSSGDLNTKEKCVEFLEYFSNVLGPVINALRVVYSVQPVD